MNGNQNDRTYRFSQAAAALGMTEAALRNWMTRSKLDLWGTRPSGGWRTFTDEDVIVLAVAACMVRFGAGANAAVDAIRRVIVNAEPIPYSIFAAPYPRGSALDGKWRASTDKELVDQMTGGAGVLEIPANRLAAAALKRLAAGEAD
jgi:hypothetical protein